MTMTEVTSSPSAATNARYQEAADEFARREGRFDSMRVATNFAYGLNLLRDHMFERVHFDVQQNLGTDSMFVPTSLVKSEARTKVEIDIYQIIQAADETEHKKYLQGDGSWFLPWLTRLQLGDDATNPKVLQRLDQYRALDPDQRRLTFSTILERVFPDARRAPLIVYQLLPLASAIVAAVAFDDMHRADELRRRQKSLLPAINECRECHGEVFENGEFCRQCGNPVWKFKWLTAD